MELENRCKSKSRFFGLYYGQNVLLSPSYTTPIRLTGHWVESASNYEWLLLRSISSLTDDELIIVARLAYGSAWEDENCIASRVPNADNIHGDIVSVEIQTYINFPPVPKFYKCCHVQFDKVDYDVNLYRFINDAKEAKDDIIGSFEQVQIADYLRSIGILLPFMNLSVEEVIAKGWAKIST